MEIDVNAKRTFQGSLGRAAGNLRHVELLPGLAGWRTAFSGQWTGKCEIKLPARLPDFAWRLACLCVTADQLHMRYQFDVVAAGVGYSTWRDRVSSDSPTVLSEDLGLAEQRDSSIRGWLTWRHQNVRRVAAGVTVGQVVTQIERRRTVRW